MIKQKAQLSNIEKQDIFFLNNEYLSTEKRTYLIAGIERGGTSMVAGVCRALGLDMGDKNGLNHEDPQFLTDSKNLLKERIKIRNQFSKVWGFKAPKASKKLSFYQKNLRNPHFIFIYRNSIAVADSWIKRNAGNMTDVLSRILDYHSAQLELIRNTKCPVMIINYERVVSSKENQNSFVNNLSHFLRLEPSDDQISAASSMITGDGGGYMNLPQEYFSVERASKIIKTDPLNLTKQNAPHIQIEKNNFLKYTKVAPGEIFKLKNKKNLPQKFFLEIDIQSSDLKDFENNPIRIFFNFTGKRHPGHCSRPEFNHGKNFFYVETSGLAKDLSLGLIDVPKSIKFDVKAFKK